MTTTRTRILLALVLVLAVVVTARAQSYDDPLACLPDRPDGALTWALDSDGHWRYQGSSDVPTLAGVRGEWHGYDKGDDWESAFGFPNDMTVTAYTVLYRADKQVGWLYFYTSPTHPDMTVLFTFTSLEQNADSSGQHMGSHRFCWHGSLIE